MNLTGNIGEGKDSQEKGVCMALGVQIWGEPLVQKRHKQL